MAPDAENRGPILRDDEKEDTKLVAPQAGPRKYTISYFTVLIFLYWHLAGLYGLYLAFTAARWPTVIFTAVTYVVGVLGITAGSHRLWAHRTYKAKLPLQVILMVFHCVSSQNSAVHWARDHRLHHKFSDTDADPHNATRGMFYSHFGWLWVKKHPEVLKKGKTVDVSDLYNNPVLRFQKRYTLQLIGFFSFFLPTLIPMYFWGETFSNSWHLVNLRLMGNLNATFLVNSLAHAFGNKPYDGSIAATQSVLLSLFSLGECFHNYHHVFPWDYRTAEFGNNWINFTTKFIDFFAWVGWAYDLKTVSDDMIAKRTERTGDGTNLWGWGDKDLRVKDSNFNAEDNIYYGWSDENLTLEDRKDVNVLYSEMELKDAKNCRFSGCKQRCTSLEDLLK